MKIALAQIEVVPGRPDINLETMLRMIEQAKEENVDLVAFPEMCVGGYLLGDKWLEENICDDLMEFNEEIRKASDGIAIAYGNVYMDRNEEINKRVNDKKFHPNKDGRQRKYNAVYVFQNGKEVQRAKTVKEIPKGVQPKTLLPNYRFFDDERYFFSLQDVAKDFGMNLEDLLQPFLIDIDGKKVPIGFELCEDLWCADYRRKSEALNPTKAIINNGAEYIVNVSASPWTFGKNNARDRRVSFLKSESSDNFVPFLYVNCTGVQNNGKNVITFDGGSTVYNKNGEIVVLGNSCYQEELMIITEEDLEGNTLKREEELKIAQKYKALIRGIKHMKDVTAREEQPLYFIGLSGGVDSAVVASLLSIAVGTDKVVAVNMPTRYNTEKTKNAAKQIANALGIKYVEMPIENLVSAVQKTIDACDVFEDERQLSGFNMENVQAKIRGTDILSNIAAKYRGLFTNNGNKLETALGYATLYGDIGGAIAPIADLTKSEVFELARYLNNEIFKKEVIPEALIPDELFRFREDQIQPSAELKSNQVDPIKFGYHCALIEKLTDFKKRNPEDVMQWYLDGTMEQNLGISTELIKRWGIDDPEEFVKDLEWFAGKICWSVFKRIQGPPIIITSKSSYGYDIRESMLPYTSTYNYEKLREKVLSLEKYQPNKV